MNPTKKQKDAPDLEDDTLEPDEEEGAEPAEGDYDDMTEEELQGFLTEALDAFADENELRHLRTSTFEEAGLLTNNHGLVLRIGDSEFQLSIVRAR